MKHGDEVQDVFDSVGDLDKEARHLYGVELSWFDESDEYNTKGAPEDQIYLFTQANLAIDFAYNAAYTSVGEQLGDPIDIYIIPVELVSVGHGHMVPRIDTEAGFLASYHDADRNLKIHEPR